MSERESMNLVLENFDADAFLHIEYDRATETARTLLPPGWVKIKIKNFSIEKPKLVDSKKEPGVKNWTSPQLKLECLVMDEGLREQLNIPEGQEMKCYPRVYLDLDPSTGALDMGPNRNIMLGQLRAALGQNEPGVHWNLGMLRDSGEFNTFVTIDVPDENKPDQKYERYGKFAKEPEQKAA
jgi:hypothetical protein